MISLLHWLRLVVEAKKRKLLFILAVLFTVAILLGSIWGAPLLDTMLVSAWHIRNGDVITYDGLNIVVPRNWIALRSKDSVSILRYPDGTGSISLSVGHEAISRQDLKTKPMEVTEGGAKIFHDEVKNIEIGGFPGAFAHKIYEPDSYKGTFTVPERRLSGVFTVDREAFEEVLKILQSISFQ